jgi:hypothetical protein
MGKKGDSPLITTKISLLFSLSIDLNLTAHTKRGSNP